MANSTLKCDVLCNPFFQQRTFYLNDERSENVILIKPVCLSI